MGIESEDGGTGGGPDFSSILEDDPEGAGTTLSGLAVTIETPNDVTLVSTTGGSVRMTVNSVEAIQVAPDGGSGVITSLREQVDFENPPTVGGLPIVPDSLQAYTTSLSMPGLGGTDTIASYNTPIIQGSSISVDNFGAFHLAVGKYRVELNLRLISGDTTYSGGFVDIITQSVSNIGTTIQNVFLHMPLEANGIDTKSVFGIINAGSGATFKLGIDNEVADSMDQTAVLTVNIVKIA